MGLAAGRRLEDVYRNHPVPLYLVARHAGVTEFDLMEFFALDGRPGVACVNGGPAQVAGALAAERAAARVVVDLTAMHTLGRFGLPHVLAAVPARPIVARST